MVTPSGGKLWRWNYEYDGKNKTMAFGAYPRVSLADAREKRDEAWSMLCEGQDPNVAKRLKIEANLEAGRQTFERVAREWHENAKAQWATLRATMAGRQQWLVEQQLADVDGDRVRLRANAIMMLQRRELLRTGRAPATSSKGDWRARWISPADGSLSLRKIGNSRSFGGDQYSRTSLARPCTGLRAATVSPGNSGAAVGRKFHEPCYLSTTSRARERAPSLRSRKARYIVLTVE